MSETEVKNAYQCIEILSGKMSGLSVSEAQSYISSLKVLRDFVVSTFHPLPTPTPAAKLVGTT